MNSSIKKVLKNSAFFSICVIASKAIGFFLLPLYTSYLSTDAYGAADTVTTLVLSLDIVVMLGLREALLRFYPSFDEEKQRKYVGTVFITVMTSGMVVVFLLTLTRNLWSSKLLAGIDFFPVVFCGILTLFFETVYLIYQSVLQSKQDGRGYSVNGIFYGVCQAIFNVLFIAVFKMGALGMILGGLVANILFAVYGTIEMFRKKYLIIHFDKSLCFDSLKYSLPFIPHNLSSTIANLIAKLLMNNESYATTGLYSVSARISSIMSLVQQALNLAFRPWFNEQMELGDEGRRNIYDFSCIMFSSNAFCCIGIAFFSKEVIYLFTAAEYHQSWKLVPILTLALVIDFIYYIHILTIMYEVKASKLIALCSMSGSLSNIFIASMLIPKISSWGAALAVLLSKIIMATITVIYSRKVNPVNFGLKNMIVQLVWSTLIISAGLLYDFIYEPISISIISIVIKIICLSVAFFILFFNMRTRLKDFVKNILKR